MGRFQQFTKTTEFDPRQSGDGSWKDIWDWKIGNRGHRSWWNTVLRHTLSLKALLTETSTRSTRMPNVSS